MKKQKTESHYRSILKGITWRIVGTVDTIFISFLVSGKLNTAVKIGFSEVVTKLALYYLHERIWLRFLGEREQTKKISLLKAISWRIVGTIDTMLLGWYFTGNPLSGLKIGFLEVFTKIGLFYLHERAWNRVPVGTVRKWFRLKEEQNAQ